ncbi:MULTISPECIES: magnesium transporter [unclassified Halanaerobium]|uniref:magnesium transporter n=1 Tax=unclassified Halanaerobium TaxID=2641197 RepID=UPI002100BBDE|nr:MULTISPECIES: magnesium transporter [unclassified Halanaerobium]
MEAKNLIREYLPEGYDTFDDYYSDNYPADAAEFLSELPENVLIELVEDFNYEILSQIIIFFEEELQKKIAEKMSVLKTAQVLSAMYSDDAADFLSILSVGKVKKVLKLMKENDALKLKELLHYDDESAGGRMTTEFIAFYADNTAQSVLNKIRKIITEPEMIYYIYVISRKKELVGVLSVRQLLTAQPDTKLKDIMNKRAIKVNIAADQEEAARIISKYDLLAVPVVNDHNQLLGIITVDDIIDILEEETTEDLFKISGATNAYDIRGNFMEAVKKRIPWLFILLIGDLLSGTVIHRFEASLESIVALAIFIPVLMDMGGNVGTQSLTVVVRGLATEELDFSHFIKHLFSELKAGLVMGVIISFSLFIITFLWHQNFALSSVVAFSMLITMITAVTAGTSIPFFVDYFGADPAVAAGPFITTLIDISGLFIYFTIASLLMEKLL